ncbi:MAG: universal stress protein [Candidatus Krumholzibacteriia bacterium]
MTVPRIDAVGFCAHYSPQGDWAFDYALHLAQSRGLKLNVFHFLVDPYASDVAASHLYTDRQLARMAAERERELRFYYDERAGDFLEVGFRLCYDDSWRELHRCLAEHEFQILVLAQPSPEARFCRKSLSGFAESFVCPVVLVGPERPDQYRLNGGAALLADGLHLPESGWQRIEVA